MNPPRILFFLCGLILSITLSLSTALSPRIFAQKKRDRLQDAKNTKTGKPEPKEDPSLQQFGIYEATAAHAKTATPRTTALPLKPEQGQRIALIGNTLFDRAQHYGHIESLIQQAFHGKQLTIRNLAWSADAVDVDGLPRPANFADIEQHLTHEKADIILAAYGFNESFAGPEGLGNFKQNWGKGYILLLGDYTFRKGSHSSISHQSL